LDQFFAMAFVQLPYRESLERVHVPTAMLHPAADLLSTSHAVLFEWPKDTLTMAGRVFWIAVAAELAACQHRGSRLTVPEILAWAAMRRSSG